MLGGADVSQDVNDELITTVVTKQSDSTKQNRSFLVITTEVDQSDY
jgi:hypothetical protein